MPLHRKEAPVSANDSAFMARQRGASFVELLTVLAIAAVVLIIAAPALQDAYQRQKVRAVASETAQVMRYVRLLALKEKVPHRVVFHDVSDYPANTIEVQRQQSGSFVTIPGHVYAAPSGVLILDSDPTDSIDSVIVGSRGECQSGQVFIQGPRSLEVVSIKSTCHTSKG